MFWRKPSVLFFPVNGSGLGHLTRCLAYARRLPKNYKISFFSLSPAIEAIEQMGFYADYFVSPFWSDNSPEDWNAELALRFGLMLEETRPNIVVFDGTWPFKGMRQACRNYQLPLKMVWSRRGLLKKDAKKVTVDEFFFDLLLYPGEMDSQTIIKEIWPNGHVKISLPPVCLFNYDELLGRDEARKKLNLPLDKNIALLCLGPGNLKNVTEISGKIIGLLRKSCFDIACLRSPITLGDAPVPAYAIPLDIYPIARYLNAFDCVISAAGYNTCCEIMQSGICAMLLPNELVADDQYKRAHILKKNLPVVICEGAREEELEIALYALFEIMEKKRQGQYKKIKLTNGAGYAARAIECLLKE